MTIDLEKFQAHLPDMPTATAAAAPPITAFLSDELIAKFNDRRYAVPASERWIAVTEQILENQKAILTQLGYLAVITAAIQAINNQLQMILQVQEGQSELLRTLVDAIPKKPGPATGGDLEFRSDPA